MPEFRMTASIIYENPTMADLMKQGEQGIGALGLQKTETIIFQLNWNQRVLLTQLQRKGHILLFYQQENKVFYRRNVFGFYKVDNSGRVRGQKQNELDVMNASLGHPE